MWFKSYKDYKKKLKKKFNKIKHILTKHYNIKNVKQYINYFWENDWQKNDKEIIDLMNKYYDLLDQSHHYSLNRKQRRLIYIQRLNWIRKEENIQNKEKLDLLKKELWKKWIINDWSD